MCVVVRPGGVAALLLLPAMLDFQLVCGWELEVPVWLVFYEDDVVFLAEGVDFPASVEGKNSSCWILPDAMDDVSIKEIAGYKDILIKYKRVNNWCMRDGLTTRYTLGAGAFPCCDPNV